MLLPLCEINYIIMLSYCCYNAMCCVKPLNHWYVLNSGKMQRQPRGSGSACFSWNWLWLCKQGYLLTYLIYFFEFALVYSSNCNIISFVSHLRCVKGMFIWCDVKNLHCHVQNFTLLSYVIVCVVLVWVMSLPNVVKGQRHYIIHLSSIPILLAWSLEK